MPVSSVTLSQRAEVVSLESEAAQGSLVTNQKEEGSTVHLHWLSIGGELAKDSWLNRDMRHLRGRFG